MEKEKENEAEDKFVIKYYEPYDDVIYFMKTVTVKEVRKKTPLYRVSGKKIKTLWVDKKQRSNLYNIYFLLWKNLHLNLTSKVINNHCVRIEI